MFQKKSYQTRTAIQKINEYLDNVHSTNLPALQKCLKYLLENDCLSTDNVNKLVTKSKKNNLSMELKALVMKALSDKNILNQHNFDNCFNHPIIVDDKEWSRQYIWRTLFETLLKNKDLITQDNLNKIFLHKDFKNLMKILNILSPEGQNEYRVITQDFLKKITDQSDLASFEYLLRYIPNSVWRDAGDLATIVDKLIQCNKKLGNQKIITERRQQLDYTTIDRKHLARILTECNSAPTSKAAVAIFNTHPIPLLHSEKIANSYEYPSNQINHENNSSPPILPTTPLSNNSLLFLGYGISMLFKPKNSPVSNFNGFVSNGQSRQVDIDADIIIKQINEAKKQFGNTTKPN